MNLVPQCRRLFSASCFRSYLHQTQTRGYAAPSAGHPIHRVFDSHTKYLQKERAASNPRLSRQVDYLRDEVAKRLCERLLYIKRQFPKALDLGAGPLTIARTLASPNPDPIASISPALSVSHAISHLVCADTSPTFLHRDDLCGVLGKSPPFEITRQTLASYLPLHYDENTFDLVLSSMALHWINDLPSILQSIHNILKPDCPFLAAMLGGDSLYELRSSLQLADQERLGGVSPHVSPLADVRDMGGLLTRAGFKMLTVDIDDIVVGYPDMFTLMVDLQNMGEGNAVAVRQKSLLGLSRDVLLASNAIYQELYGEEWEGKDVQHQSEDTYKSVSIPATFRIIYMIGWKEGKETPKPAPRGSGTINLQDALGHGRAS